MSKFLLFSVFALVVSTVGTQAQEPSTRYTKQHMKQTIESLAYALNHESAGVQASAAQAIRQLEWMFPQEPFNEILEPLMNIVKDEKADTRVRILSAIALDALHSDTGDSVIEDAAKSSTNKSLMELCSALIIKSDKYK